MSSGEPLHIDPQTGQELREERLQTDTAARLAARMRALGDPTRLGLALTLRGEQELCVCDLSWVAERPQNLVSHHMKILKSEGLVTARREGKMTMYALTELGRALTEAALAARESAGGR